MALWTIESMMAHISQQVDQEVYTARNCFVFYLDHFSLPWSSY